MHAGSLIERVTNERARAAEFEGALEPVRRKRLGQFFSGLPLGRVLAAVSLQPDARTVLDPMAGSGDLLDAAIERANNRSPQLIQRVEGVEIDPASAKACRERLSAWEGCLDVSAISVRNGDAFAWDVARDYASDGYDLVITNPPYVRYQTLAAHSAHDGNRAPADLRRDLLRVIQAREQAGGRAVFQALINSYSGLADLSVPAWILTGSLVKPGGMLALIAPATWRSRNYGDVIEYLLSRLFRIRYLVEDTQPGWFSNALVRTQLVIAQRLGADEAQVPLADRPTDTNLVVIARVSPEASDDRSLVGSSFAGPDPEAGFAAWLGGLATGSQESRDGLSWETVQVSSLSNEVVTSLRDRKWFRSVEPSLCGGNLFEGYRPRDAVSVPAQVREAVAGYSDLRTQLLPEGGIAVGQGLRTGCNGFFYVDFIAALPEHRARVRLSASFGNQELVVPAACLSPVLRRQSEYVGNLRAARLPGRVLDLSRWVLPEDAEVTEQARDLYRREGIPLPEVMPSELAQFVRLAAETIYQPEPTAKRIPELSAVKTNVRNTKGRAPRFWYMLPIFARRHRPDVFIPRINQGIPFADANDAPPAIIDANFSTLYGESPLWTAPALRSLLNSSWSRACMEALGTSLGGGALKLEATQLKQIPIPILEKKDLEWLTRHGSEMDGPNPPKEAIDAFVIERIVGQKAGRQAIDEINQRLLSIADELCRNRQRRST